MENLSFPGILCTLSTQWCRKRFSWNSLTVLLVTGYGPATLKSDVIISSGVPYLKILLFGAQCGHRCGKFQRDLGAIFNIRFSSV